MKKFLLLPAMVIAGVGTGAGAAFAVQYLVAPKAPHADAAATVPTSFVPVPRVLAPLVMGDGRLAGYISFDVELEVPTDQVATITQRLPLLLHAINMRTYRNPLAAGPDGMLPDIAGLRTLVMAAAPEAFGAGIVRRVAVTRSEPA